MTEIVYAKHLAEATALYVDDHFLSISQASMGFHFVGGQEGENVQLLSPALLGERHGAVLDAAGCC